MGMPINQEGEAEKPKTHGVKKYHVISQYRVGEIGVYDSLEEAEKAAAEFLYHTYAALIEQKKEGADVKIVEVLHFGILDALDFPPPPEPAIAAGKTVIRRDV